jgi:outer membrane protein, multidrug efflux system
MQRINNLQQYFDVKSKKVDKLQSSLETSFALYRSGRANYLEVLFTQQNTLQSRLEQVETGRELWISAVFLYKARL